MEEPDAEARASLFEPAAQGGADLFLAGQRGGGVHSRSPLPGDAELGQAQGQLQRVGGGFQRLGGDAAVVQAGSAEVPAFHEGHGHPGAGGGKGGRVPAGASPDDGQAYGHGAPPQSSSHSRFRSVFHREGRFERARDQTALLHDLFHAVETEPVFLIHEHGHVQIDPGHAAPALVVRAGAHRGLAFDAAVLGAAGFERLVQRGAVTVKRGGGEQLLGRAGPFFGGDLLPVDGNDAESGGFHIQIDFGAPAGDGNAEFV